MNLQEIDQGLADDFLAAQLRPELLEAACQAAGHPLTLRLWPGGLGAAWFVEGGIGAVLANRRYSTPSKTFSTRWNFASHLGVGVRLGAQQQHEWLLRVQHVSNASLKKPNPGENFLQLRYALHF